ncbi:YibE/F family protein [Lentilactobacillus sp. SPB1-3]|uniref:YibE/F family protein n=1 Tax=Lentilactobacillus terminaliae TaxID=3003483 RepID=A0ACD5DFU3_9LACO|nr:YibE/F family protein [Lentilactobacillus sp. SPB1-3]MCZ0976531.1 YibE/F family protein [Lentilactobacillus sp. SPB1-3]
MQLIKSVKWSQILAIIIVCIGVVVLVDHNDQFYSTPIMKVTSVKNYGSNKVTDEFQNRDYEHQQKVTGTITNGQHAGQKLTIGNEYSDSGAMDQKLHPGQKVFLTIHNHKKLQANVKDIKRDTTIAFLITLAVCLLFVFLKKQGTTVVSSIVINTILFILAIRLNSGNNGANVIWIFSVLAVIFCTLTLLLVVGWNQRMWVSLAAVISATVVTLVLLMAVFGITQERGVYYESMQYVTQLPRPLFVAEVLIGVLGAVMDESVDIVAALATLKNEQPTLSKRQIFNSGRQIGRSIMGPLINVLFFVFMAETLPMTLVYLRNGNSWSYSFSMNMSLGMLSSLVSAIGIVLTVIFASFLSSMWLKAGER